jgi:serine/threonine protein kinase
VDVFLRNVLRSGLMDQARLREALASLPDSQRRDTTAVAEHLIRVGKLSRFQAKKLLKGQAKGLLFGPYQVLAQIGKGGMGTVYLARDERHNHLVALKVLPPRKARAKERMLDRFRREMELSQRVNHPYIARTFQVGEWKEVQYIAMEFIPGKSLYRMVQENGLLEVPQAARLGAQVASALAHAHRQGLIHRDLKPSNILVMPNGNAKVLDLGLALIEGEDVSDAQIIGGQGHIVGTMDYIAPEQTEDSAGVDGRADIYSLGCTLYYALSGSPPFPGGTSKDKIQRQRYEEPVSLLVLRPGLTPGFVQIVQRMMAKRPDQRYPNAAAVEHDLRKWAAPQAAPTTGERDDSALRIAVAQLANAEPSVDDSTWTQVSAEPEGPVDPGRAILWLLAGLVGIAVLSALLAMLLRSS